MKRRLAALGALVLAVAGSVVLIAQPASAATGLHVDGRNIVEADGRPFIMRGVNHGHAWFTDRTSSFADIKALGANTVRVVLSGGRWTANKPDDVAKVVSLCKENRLICVLEDHDTTGYGEDGAAYSLDQAVDYWIGLKDVLTGQEDYVVINIGNEPIGNTDPGQWTDATTAAIQKMRSNGFEHLLMVDAPNWGQDWKLVMRDNAQAVLDADSRHNTVLSIHMYDVFNTATSITDYLDHFRNNGWPLVIGEFGWQRSSDNVDHETVLSEAVSRDLGYLGWSWAGNNDPYLDMTVDFDPDQLTSWGKRIFNGENGIRATAEEATIYGGGTGTTPPTTQPTTAPPTTTEPTTAPPTTTQPATETRPGAARTCTASYSVLEEWPGSFQGEVRVQAGSAAITGWTVTWTFGDGQTVTQAWNATVTSNESNVTARNVSHNGNLAAGASATFGFLGSRSGANGTPEVSCSTS